MRKIAWEGLQRNIGVMDGDTMINKRLIPHTGKASFKNDFYIPYGP